MSVQAIRWAAEQQVGSPMAKLVLYALAEHANRDGTTHTSVATLVRETESSRRTVVRALAALADRGVITRTRRQRGTGADTSNEYRLTLDSGAATSPLEGHTDTTRCPAGTPPMSTRHPRSATPTRHASAAPAPQGEPELQNRTTEPSGSPRRHGTVTPTDLAATAVRPDAYRLMAAWREHTGAAYRPATLRALAKHADTLLRDGADPTAVRAALDEWHHRPGAQPGLLPHLYDDAVKIAHRADRPPRSTRGDKVRGWLALADPTPTGQLAVGGGR